MNKKIITAICLIIGASLFCCTKFFVQNHFPQKTVVQFASWGSESEISILKPILEDFEKQNPNIKINFYTSRKIIFKKYIYFSPLTQHRM